jgi:hypothetical protein
MPCSAVHLDEPTVSGISYSKDYMPKEYKEGVMSEVEIGEPFAAYSALLAVQMDLCADLQTTDPDQATVLHEDIALVGRDITLLETDPDLTQSALRYGTTLVHEVATIGKDACMDDTVREGYERRLRMVASFVLEHGVGSWELTEDPRFYEIQVALGGLAADNVEYLPAAPAMEMETTPLEPVNHTVALQNLRAHLLAMAPGESYTLSPTQVLSLAAPNMAFSRWQRYRLLHQARELLTAEGHIFSYNNGRGRSSAYTVGRPAQVYSSIVLIAA